MGFLFHLPTEETIPDSHNVTLYEAIRPLHDSLFKSNLLTPSKSSGKPRHSKDHSRMLHTSSNHTSLELPFLLSFLIFYQSFSS
jgi:hypothetical protein